MIGDWNFFSRELNAQRCVVALEARMRYFDVVARPSYGIGDPMLKNEEWLSVFDYSPSQIKNCAGKTSAGVIASAKKIMRSFGEGSRAIVWFNWADYDSVGTHVLVSILEEGEVKFGDPQSSNEPSPIFKRTQQTV